MKKILTAIVALSMLVWAGTAFAATVTDLYGDKDGFGIGLMNGYSQSTFPPPDIVADDAADVGTITDRHLTSDHTWSRTFDLSSLGAITSASLEIMTYAQGYKGLSSLYLDGTLIGTLTDGDTTYEPGSPNLNMAWIDTFDLMAFAGDLLDSASILRIDTVRSDDWWYLDYSELTISDDGAPVPEPSTMLLFGSGLAGLAFYRRKRK